MSTFNAVLNSNYRLSTIKQQNIFAYEKNENKISLIYLGSSNDTTQIKKYIDNMIKITGHNKYFILNDDNVYELNFNKTEIKNEFVECVQNYIDYESCNSELSRLFQDFKNKKHILSEIDSEKFLMLISNLENKDLLYDKFIELTKPKIDLIDLNFS